MIRGAGADRGSWGFRGLVAVAVVAVVVGGLVGVRHLARWWEGPPVLGVAGEGAGAVAVSPDGKVLYAANWGESGDVVGVTVLDAATGRRDGQIATGGAVVQLTMIPGGRAMYALVAGAGDSERLVRIDLPKGRNVAAGLFRYGALDMAAAPDGSLLYVLAATSPDAAAIVPVDVGSGRAEQAIGVPADSRAVAVSPDGRTLYVAAGSADGKGQGEIVSVDLRSGAKGKATVFAHPVISVAIKEDGTVVGLSSGRGRSCAADSCAQCELIAAAVRRPIPLHSRCDQVAASPDGRHLFVLNADNTLTVVDAKDSRVTKTLRTAPYIASQGDAWLAASPDGRTVYIADEFRGVAVVPVP